MDIVPLCLNPPEAIMRAKQARVLNNTIVLLVVLTVILVLALVIPELLKREVDAGAVAISAVVAFVIAMGVAIPVGILSAIHRNSFLDAVVRVVALLGQSLPIFWTGIVLILIFAVRLRLLPTSGRGEFRHLIYPVLRWAPTRWP